MPKLTLVTLPVELLTLIFSFACTDAGQTGCFLGLVCKPFRDVCLHTGVDIQFARVCGERRLGCFLDMLEKREERARKVESLFLSYDDGEKRNEEADFHHTGKGKPIVVFTPSCDLTGDNRFCRFWRMH